MHKNKGRVACSEAYASSLNYNNLIRFCDFRTEDYNKILKTKNTYQRQFAHTC